MHRFGLYDILRIGVVLGFVLVASDAGAQSAEAVRRAVEGGSEVNLFYEQRGFEPVWMEGGSPRARADSALALLAGAASHGISPEAWGYAGLSKSLDRARITSLPEADAARVEVALSGAVLHLARVYHAGWADPRGIHPAWQVTPPPLDTPAFLERVVELGRWWAAFEALAPATDDYRALRNLLEDLREIEQAGGWPAIPPAHLEPGAVHPAVATLRNRLVAGGDLDPVASPEPYRFDSLLEDGVRRFQRRHGLETDGVVGPATRAALNVPVAGRIRQVALNLERLRWMPAPGPRRVVVNSAGCRLVAEVDGEPVLTMPVIVGATDTATPVFNALIAGMTLAPAWYVPASIAEKEILPEVEKDSTYLARHQMQVLPSGVIRQEPGPANPLGRVKFAVANPYDIGLHDTPDRRRFGQAACTFSHGCVRLGDPLGLALFVLQEAPEWTRVRLEETIATWVETPIPAPLPVPLYVVYHTAWVDAEEIPQFRPDRYGYDARLERLLPAL